MHLTARMAWHDNNWNGTVCNNPELNTYCTGAHSLLSGRIEKLKNTHLEQTHKGEAVAEAFTPNAVPPCYWSINAFSQQGFEVEHGHAFDSIKHTIPDEVKPYSVFTWPFKLSFNHSDDKKKAQGNYPAGLDQRIDDFINKFTPGQSIIFFYANYDNPVSADEMKYLLVGCSVISELPSPQHFPLTEKELSDIRESKKGKHKMKNFPTMNWSLQFTHNPENLVLLPYREYIRYAEENPEDEEKLHEIKVIIEEESLVRGFKYVAMDIDDDKCLYLLYKLRKSIKKIQEHEQQIISATLAEEEQRVADLINIVWQKRGIYPALGKILTPFFDDDEDLAQEIAQAIIKITDRRKDLLNVFQDIMKEDIPDELEDIEDDLFDLADSRLFRKNVTGLAKLSLFNLTQHQISKIISDTALLAQVANNPYILYESYEAVEDDLDQPNMQDEPIDVYKIDIGMIPDRKFVKRHRGLQNLREDSPERVRSVIINYLWKIGELGHCYDHTDNILDEIREYPLIYKNDITIDEQALINLDSDYKSHFLEKLYFEEQDGKRYFYLKLIQTAEVQVKKLIEMLVARPDHASTEFDEDTYILESLDSDHLKGTITSEDEDLFIDERKQLYQNVFKKSLFLLTGKPGAGKTHEVNTVIKHIENCNEDILILAPTGKAALRLTELLKENNPDSDLTARTIDRYIYQNGFGWAADNLEKLAEIPDKDKLVVENLIIDECSMIDLIKLKILLSTISFNDSYPKRIFLVGDENPLPPIGFGKPFHDIINYIISTPTLIDQHYINLRSNCRQENDKKILHLAEAFTDKKRYYEEALDMLEEEGQVSDGLFIHKWRNQDELNALINDCLATLFNLELNSQTQELETDPEKLNALFGLYKNGFVNNQNYQFKEHLKLDNFQLLSPYRAGYYGTLGVNQLIQTGYRSRKKYSSKNSNFYHSDKIIRLYNWYWGWGTNRQLILSNGSIGVVNGENTKRRYYFKDLDKPRYSVDNEEHFDLAYAITVHKSQGSDFKNVFLVVPQKYSLLSKELIYTALTRSRYRLFLFIQEGEENLLKRARNISHLIHRNTAIFTKPQDNRRPLYPDPNKKPVKSRIEYIIYRSLQKSGLNFEYEQLLKLKERHYNIHPDFAIKLKNGRTIYWEHLGMLDTQKYYQDWQRRKKDYADHRLFDNLITTDDLNGINQQKIDSLIEDIRKDQLKATDGNKFSNHHYELY